MGGLGAVEDAAHDDRVGAERRGHQVGAGSLEPGVEVTLAEQVGRDRDLARALLEEGVEVSRSVGDRALETEALDELGYWHVVAGDPRGGISVLSDGLALVDDRGAGQWEVSIRRRLAMALDGLGRHDEADEHWRTALRRHEQRGERRQAAELRQLWASRVSMRRTGPTRAATSRRTSPA